MRHVLFSNQQLMWCTGRISDKVWPRLKTRLNLRPPFHWTCETFVSPAKLCKWPRSCPSQVGRIQRLVYSHVSFFVSFFDSCEHKIELAALHSFVQKFAANQARKAQQAGAMEHPATGLGLGLGHSPTAATWSMAPTWARTHWVRRSSAHLLDVHYTVFVFAHTTIICITDNVGTAVCQCACNQLLQGNQGGLSS